MELATAQNEEIVRKFGKSEKDTGRTEVQIALLTKRILNLAPHFDEHKHDYHSQRGLMKLIGQRRRLLKYLSLNDSERYKEVIKELGLRK